MVKQLIKGIIGLAILISPALASKFDELAFLGKQILDKGGVCRHVSVAIHDEAIRMGFKASVMVFKTIDPNTEHSVVVVNDGSLYRIYDFITSVYKPAGDSFPGPGFKSFRCYWKTHKHEPRLDHLRDFEIDGPQRALSLKEYIETYTESDLDIVRQEIKNLKR